MLCAALLDLGVPLSHLTSTLSAVLPLSIHEAFVIEMHRVERSGIVAPRFVVTERHAGSQPRRDYAQIRSLLDSAKRLSPRALQIAQDAFHHLAVAEAACHGLTVDTVHFHEVGAIDAIVDILSCAICLDYLGADRIACSPLPTGTGVIYGAAHGPLPCPPPAVVQIACAAGIPLVPASRPTRQELVTPTGACLVAAVADEYCAWPSMVPVVCGYGAGKRNPEDRPNVVRLILGKKMD